MTKTLDLKQFVDKANLIHNYKYDYRKVYYVNAFTNVIIICKIHGDFIQSPNNHIYNKRICPKCSRINTIKKLTHNTSIFIEKANIIHNNKYDYIEVNYLNAKSKVKIKCLDHGFFEQTPLHHLSGQGCKICKNVFLSKSRTSNLEDFIEKANVIHKNKYDYSQSIYLSSYDKIGIICPFHGIFYQNVNSHLSGSGCKKCKNLYKENKWLDSLNIVEKYRQYRILLNNRLFIVDGFDPMTNTIYEFYGDYWHGNLNRYNQNNLNKINKKTFKELYDKTLEREKILIENNFKLITIWETDFDKKKRIKIK